MTTMEPEEVRAHVRVYLTVFFALGVLTAFTVGISYLRLETHYAILLALAVATVKASLVACYFMHLISEEKVIHWILYVCVGLFAILMLVPVLFESGVGPLWPL